MNKAAESEHKIKGKDITVKKADVKQGKIYVGKLPASGVDEEDVENHFSQFGDVAEVIRPIDKMKDNKPKNFCFDTFEKERVAKQMIEEGSCTINCSKMMIKSVTPNPRDPSSRGGIGWGNERKRRQGWKFRWKSLDEPGWRRLWRWWLGWRLWRWSLGWRWWLWRGSRRL